MGAKPSNYNLLNRSSITTTFSLCDELSGISGQLLPTTAYPLIFFFLLLYIHHHAPKSLSLRPKYPSPALIAGRGSGAFGP
jgi:hypothetical protein